MFKQVLRKAYNAFPLRSKFLVRDLYFYVKSRLKGAVPVSQLYIHRDHDKVAVVGNGPSLKNDKLQFSSMKESHDFICVNNFCDDEIYEIIKPKLYIFLDGYFFSENAHPDWVNRREKTFFVINEKTNWPMTIIIPHSASQEILRRSISNSNIKIVNLATQSLFCKSYSAMLGKIFDSGIYGPPQINVLIYSVYLAIVTKYKIIKIYGADLSFHKDIDVDQATNELYITFKHFNENNTVEVLRKNPEKVQKWKMGELLELCSDTFFAHEVIAEYAKSKKVKIFNKSDQSLIDAYPRSE
jgi:hypothetical protein